MRCAKIGPVVTITVDVLTEMATIQIIAGVLRQKAREHLETRLNVLGLVLHCDDRHRRNYITLEAEMFRVGMKVVCIDDSPLLGCGWSPGTKPTLDAVYTIRELGMTFHSKPGMRLVELNLSGKFLGDSFTDAFYRAARFRPVVERKTDISIFQKLLTPTRVDA